jgi:hypothetical protein
MKIKWQDYDIEKLFLTTAVEDDQNETIKLIFLFPNDIICLSRNGSIFFGLNKKMFHLSLAFTISLVNSINFS